MDDWESLVQAAGGGIAVKTWGEAAQPPVLALHGWMDNAASFDLLAPRLSGLRVLAPDLPGHGRSAHRPRGADYYIWSYVEEVLALADALDCPRFLLLGHSMGGAIACLAAALYPERVAGLALLDSLGPLVTAAADAPRQMRRALDQRASGRARRFATRAAAEQARAQRGVSLAAARALGRRGIERDADGWYWCADRRLARPNPLRLNEEQVAAFMGSIRCPVRLVAAAPEHQPWREGLFERRRASIPQLEVVQLGGGHHQHMEKEWVDQVAIHLAPFLRGSDAAQPLNS